MGNGKNMITKPTQYPEWATTDVIDPIEGTPNVLEPPKAKKEVGWIPGEQAPNNFMNWIHRLTNDWVKYFDSVVPETLTNNIARPSAVDVGAGKILYISDLGEGGTMAFSDGTNWRKISDNSIIN
jgi:hypothetical protein